MSKTLNDADVWATPGAELPSAAHMWQVHSKSVSVAICSIFILSEFIFWLMWIQGFSILFLF